MDARRRQALTAALRTHVAKVAADMRAQMMAPGTVRDRARALHAEERVGEAFDVWTDLLSRRAAVLWVLKSVYVRVLEDRGLVTPARIVDPDSQHLFERIAPNLGETAFLRWIYRDLASPQDGLPELFGWQPAEFAWPADVLSRELLEFWRHEDPDTKARWTFANERFDGELMGDLYQELDPVAKERYALCQTPDFVREFILDRTLMPAIEEFGADTVRLIDPACGSGHFLIDGLKRIVEVTRAQHPDWAPLDLVKHCLNRVIGIDLNDYACALARARLVMTAAELAGLRTLAQDSVLHPHIYWADGLEQVEWRDTLYTEPGADAPRASLSRPEARAALHSLLAPGFHAVVANPPYITESDEAAKAYHKEKVNGRPRYVSAHRQYSLGAPFTERCFQLAVPTGFVGIITSNNFMKREFGKPLIEKVLSRLDLSLIVDTSQAYIPHHGTPTVMLFGRKRAPTNDSVRAVMGKRGEVGTPEDPATGHVWTSIVRGWAVVGFETDFVSVAELHRSILSTHPWSLTGGGAADACASLDTAATQRLGDLLDVAGFASFAGLDEPFYQPRGVLGRLGYAPSLLRPLLMGQSVRDWSLIASKEALTPYDDRGRPLPYSGDLARPTHLWRYRTSLNGVASFTGTRADDNAPWWTWYRWIAQRYAAPFRLTYSAVATHNHFALERGAFVFNNKAPIMILTLPSEAEHLALLGLLNSSTGCFWMKQVFHCKGSQGVNEGAKAEHWQQFFEFDSTKLRRFPVAPRPESVQAHARALDTLAGVRAARSVARVLETASEWTDASELRRVLLARREADLADLSQMVALQEELDWLVYGLYGIDSTAEAVPPDCTTPVLPTWLPWALELAKRDLAVRAALVQGEVTTDQPTVWFERHGWAPLLDLPPEAPPEYSARVAARQKRIATNQRLALIEQATYKRRWYRPDHEAEEQEALSTWIANRIEEAVKTRSRPGTAEHVTSTLQDDRRCLAVSEILSGRRDFSLAELVAEHLNNEAMPSHPFHVYATLGQPKRAAWERTWDEQRREDAGEHITPDVPPTYTRGDFLRPEYFGHRGKLDVPKERFTVFTEVPAPSDDRLLYGWAGWTPHQRVKALLTVDEELEDAGVPLADRVGVLDSAWRLLPDVAREDAAAAGRLKAELQAIIGQAGPTPEMLADWKGRFPPPSRSGGTKRAPRKRKTVDDDDSTEASD